MSDIITVDATAEWKRIDKYLSELFPYSRNFFHHIIERGGVTLQNNKSVKKSHKLKEGDEIHIDSLKRYLDGAVMEEAPHIQIPIIYEEEDFVVINKPKGVLSHPNSIRDAGSPSVVGRLYHHYKNLPSIGHFVRAWLIHRLDKETDGLMIVAKTEKWLAHFKNLFQQKSEADSILSKEAVMLKKFYQATSRVTASWQEFIDKLLLHSTQSKQWDTTIYILAQPHYIIQDVVPKLPHSVTKIGITKILAIKIANTDKEDEIRPYRTATLELEILTGRTHQIRYHLAKHWLPIQGDYLYGLPEDQKKQSSDKNQPSLQLTAYKLYFLSPKGQEKTFEIK